VKLWPLYQPLGMCKKKHFKLNNYVYIVHGKMTERL
jgi:hypothetical protein